VDLAPCQRDSKHKALNQGLLMKKSIVVLKHPTYTPDLAPCDFFLFPTMKNNLKGSHFETQEKIKKVPTAILNNLQENDFCKCFGSWKQ
jgi:hypothetical protein